ncbi:MAG: dUTP diphosphatase [Clostridia bacterium]|nr:dUTP diphosphatase [Clostridia bacterium]
MDKIRGFEVVSSFSDINLPKRSTARSAGYDFEAAEDITVPSIWKLALKGSENIKPTFIKTGVKAYMQEDEALFLYNRSSNPGKKGLVMANSVGVVDSDYYNNADNEGHIMFAFYNFFPVDVTIKKGDRIGQGVFKKFLKADGDDAAAIRTGGFGSTK